MAIQFQDYYRTLGVGRDATSDELKLAFRKLARIHHPDVATDKVAGEARFKEINEAYDVLSDPEKRRRYDELGEHWQDAERSGPGFAASQAARGQPGHPDFEFHGTGFSDFFESFFGGAARGDPFAREGSDAEADLLVTLEEALRGALRKITLRRSEAGSAAGRIDTYQVRIPSGVHEGQRIRLAGQGGPGRGGLPAGDLYLRVRLARHPDFTVDGADLLHDLALAPWEAVLGVEVKLRTLDGCATLRVPAGTAAGTRFRLRGLGLPGPDKTRGNLYATVRVRVPAVVSETERCAWEALAKTSTFNARNDP